MDGSVTTQIPDPGFGGVTEMVSEHLVIVLRNDGVESYIEIRE